MRRTLVPTTTIEDSRRSAQRANYNEEILIVSACGTEDTTGGGGGGGGTVTSVALTMPAQYAVGGSPVTTAGTLAVTWNTENANLVLAGPSSGVPAVPTFRALVAADLPTVGALGPTGDATHVAQVTTDAQGRVVTLTSVLIQGISSNNMLTNVTPTGTRPTTAFTVPTLGGLNPFAIILILNGLTMDQVGSPAHNDEFSLSGTTLTTFITVNAADKFKAFLWY